MKTNKKRGFSLIELIVVIAILGILGVSLVPTFFHSMESSREKKDKAAIDNLQTSIQMAAQENRCYKEAKKVIEESSDRQIYLIYEPNNDHVLEFKFCSVSDKTNGIMKSSDDPSAEDKVSKLKQQIADYVNGHIEPITLESEKYKFQEKYCFVLTLPDADYKVDVALYEDYAASNPVNNAANVYNPNGTTDGSKWVVPAGQPLHIHTNTNGVDDNDKGDVWRVTVVGENLDSCMTWVGEKRDGDYPSANGTISNVKHSVTMHEFYFASNTDADTLVFVITNNTANEAFVNSVTITKVSEK